MWLLVLLGCVVVLAVFVYGALTAAPRLEPAPGTESLLFFDGVCNLCHGFVNFVANHDDKQHVRFGTIQGHAELMRSKGAGRYAEGGAEALSTLVLIQGDDVFVRSDAALRVAALLPPPAKYLAAFHVLPAPLRDAGYRLVTKYRYKIFGEAESRRLPTERFKSRFIDYEGDEEAAGASWAAAAGGS
mmetsp:Transcript_28262/g.87443  ORF Transcript_28262/g.87443 Transcript_28262/m.87443 type:complete len:187 (+) Transcript_28262:1093-1653(+)